MRKMLKNDIGTSLLIFVTALLIFFAVAFTVMLAWNISIAIPFGTRAMSYNIAMIVTAVSGVGIFLIARFT